MLRQPAGISGKPDAWEILLVLFGFANALTVMIANAWNWPVNFPTWSVPLPREFWHLSLCMRLLAPIALLSVPQIGLALVGLSWAMYVVLFQGLSAELTQLEVLLPFVLLLTGRDQRLRRMAAVLLFATIFIVGALTKINEPFLSGQEWRLGEMTRPAVALICGWLAVLPNPWVALVIIASEFWIGLNWLWRPRLATWQTVLFLFTVLGWFAGRVASVHLIATLLGMAFSLPFSFASPLCWLFMAPVFLALYKELPYFWYYTPFFILQMVGLGLWLRKHQHEIPRRSSLREDWRAQTSGWRKAKVGILLLLLVLPSLLFFAGVLPVPFGFSIFSGYELLGKHFVRVEPAQKCYGFPLKLRHGYRVFWQDGLCCLQVPTASAGEFQRTRLGLKTPVVGELSQCF